MQDLENTQYFKVEVEPGNAQGVHREESLDALSDQRNNKEKRDASDGA